MFSAVLTALQLYPANLWKYTEAWNSCRSVSYFSSDVGYSSTLFSGASWVDLNVFYLRCAVQTDLCIISNMMFQINGYTVQCEIYKDHIKHPDVVP